MRCRAQGHSRFRPTAIVECNPVALRRFGGCSYRDLVRVMRSLFPTLAVLSPAGAVIPLLSDTHLDLLLADQGVVDIVGLTPAVQCRLRSAGAVPCATLRASRGCTTGGDPRRTRSSSRSPV